MGWFKDFLYGKERKKTTVNMLLSPVHNEEVDKYNKSGLLDVYSMPVYMSQKYESEYPTPYLLSAYTKSIGHRYKAYHRYMSEKYFRPKPTFDTHIASILDPTKIENLCRTDAKHKAKANLLSDFVLDAYVSVSTGDTETTAQLIDKAYLYDAPEYLYGSNINPHPSTIPSGKQYLYNSNSGSPIYQDLYRESTPPLINSDGLWQTDYTGSNGRADLNDTKQRYVYPEDECLGARYYFKLLDPEYSGITFTGYYFINLDKNPNIDVYGETNTGGTVVPTFEFSDTIPPVILREDTVFATSFSDADSKITKKALKKIGINYKNIISSLETEVNKQEKPEVINDIYLGFFPKLTDSNVHVLSYIYAGLKRITSVINAPNFSSEILTSVNLFGSTFSGSSGNPVINTGTSSGVGNFNLNFKTVTRFAFSYEASQFQIGMYWYNQYKGTAPMSARPMSQEFEFEVVKSDKTTSGFRGIHPHLDEGDPNGYPNGGDNPNDSNSDKPWFKIMEGDPSSYGIFKDNGDGTFDYIILIGLSATQGIPVDGKTYTKRRFLKVIDSNSSDEDKAENDYFFLPVQKDILENSNIGSSSRTTLLHRAMTISIMTVQIDLVRSGGFLEVILPIVQIALIAVAIYTGVGTVVAAFANGVLAGALALVEIYGVSVLLDKAFQYVDEHIGGVLGAIIKIGISVAAKKFISSSNMKLLNSINSFQALTDSTIPAVTEGVVDEDETPEEKEARITKLKKERIRNDMINPTNLPIEGFPATLLEDQRAFSDRILSLDIRYLTSLQLPFS